MASTVAWGKSFNSIVNYIFYLFPLIFPQLLHQLYSPLLSHQGAFSQTSANLTAVTTPEQLK